jgi:hypothetical protein
LTFLEALKSLIDSQNEAVASRKVEFLAIFGIAGPGGDGFDSSENIITDAAETPNLGVSTGNKVTTGGDSVDLPGGMSIMLAEKLIEVKNYADL